MLQPTRDRLVSRYQLACWTPHLQMSPNFRELIAVVMTSLPPERGFVGGALENSHCAFSDICSIFMFLIWTCLPWVLGSIFLETQNSQGGVPYISGKFTPGPPQDLKFTKMNKNNQKTTLWIISDAPYCELVRGWWYEKHSFRSMLLISWPSRHQT